MRSGAAPCRGPAPFRLCGGWRYDRPRVRDSTGALVAIWLTALVVAAALLAATGYRTRDPDSRAYITITTRLVDEPVSRWIAPQWWGAFGLQGLFRDHPAGTFVPPALLARAGYPVAQSLFVVTLACQIVALLLMAALASPPGADLPGQGPGLGASADPHRVRVSRPRQPGVSAPGRAAAGGLRDRAGAHLVALDRRGRGGRLLCAGREGRVCAAGAGAGGLWLWSRRGQATRWPRRLAGADRWLPLADAARRLGLRADLSRD